jgi:L-fuconolactonase
MMSLTRREFMQSTAAALAAPTIASVALAADDAPDALIIDTHQHLWDLSRQKLPWLESAEEVLKHDYRTEEYLAATKGLNVRAVYMEVDVAPEEEAAEAEFVIGLCRDKDKPTIAAVIGGRPASPDFEAYVKRFADSGYVKGVREVIHNERSPAGYCLREEFVLGIRTLGKHGLSFDLCMRPGELKDGLKLSELCPDTRFVLDHCGNADPKAFAANRDKTSHDPEQWKRDIEALAGRPNVICKISGIVARAPKGWTAKDLAPVVNHCLDAFGPDRVVFGGDWPVCLLGAPLKDWITALHEIIAERPAAEQRKLWSQNAIKFYGLKDV